MTYKNKRHHLHNISSGRYRSIAVATALVSMGICIYSQFFVPGIFLDDWSQGIERVILDHAKWFNLYNRRPLLFVPFLLQYRLLGLNINAYYAVLGSSYVLLALGFYLVINRFPQVNRNAYGLIVAVLFLLYPTNYTHMWLTMLHGYSALLLTVLYGLLLLVYAEGRHWNFLLAALLCLTFSLGMYEAQVGIAGLWALLLFIVFDKTSLQRRLGFLLSVWLLLGIFAAWRTLGYEAAGISDSYLDQMDIGPNLIFSRLILGFKITLLWGWTTGLQQWLPGNPSSEVTAIIIAGALIAVILFIRFVFEARLRDASTAGNTIWSSNDRFSQLHLHLRLAILAMAFIAVGYFPVILVYLPALSNYASRFNVVATFGGALFFGSLLMMGSLLLSDNARQARTYFLGMAIPLIALAALTQMSVQYSSRTAWQEQKDIWHALFDAAPDIRDGTMILLLLPGYRDRVGYQNWRRTPLDASWEVSSAVRLLYDNPTLAADVVYTDIDTHTEARLLEAGVLTKDSGEVTPYDAVVAFEYQPFSGKLEQLYSLSPELIEDSSRSRKLCPDCILLGQPAYSQLRVLVD